MESEEPASRLKECFREAKKQVEKGNKHKGLLFISPDLESAKIFIQKAKESLELCELYKEKRIDYKIPEEWFYSLYYCALAILSKFGVESRSQKWTAEFLNYLKLRDLINYEEKFIEMITVHKEKSKETEVDKREEARYGPLIKMDEVFNRYDAMSYLCQKAIFQAKEIVFSNDSFVIPGELLENKVVK